AAGRVEGLRARARRRPGDADPTRRRAFRRVRLGDTGPAFGFDFADRLIRAVRDALQRRAEPGGRLHLDRVQRLFAVVAGDVDRERRVGAAAAAGADRPEAGREGPGDAGAGAAAGPAG